MVEIIAQIIGMVAVACAVLSFQAKNDKQLLIMQSGAAFLFCVHYFMIGAYTGLAMNGVAVIRNVVYYNKDKKLFSGKWLPYFFSCIMACLGAFSWQGWHSLFIISGLMINSVGMSFKNPQNIRKSILVTSPLVLVYNIFEFSIGGIVNESLSIVSSIIGIVRYYRGNKK